MTKKLFWENPYQTECEATVTRVEGKKVVLDQSVFFAFAGGQASDQGIIGGIKVLEAVDGEDITYTLEETPTFSVGDVVTVHIDEDYRDKVRRLHSASHIVCDLWEKQSGVKEYIGSNVSVDKARIDFLFAESVGSVLPELQEKVNAFISSAQAVEVENVDGTLHWKCADIEMHCCGTHVKNTSEIGPVKLKRKNIGSGKERIEITLAQ